MLLLLIAVWLAEKQEIQVLSSLLNATKARSHYLHYTGYHANQNTIEVVN